MKIRKAIGEIKINEKGECVFNLVFNDIGEIRQKRRSKKWLVKRIFMSELKTALKHGENIQIVGG